MEGHIEEISIAEIREGLVRVSSAVVFDWDNTLKKHDSAMRSIRSGVDRNVLEKWKEDRQCRLFVISAIRPTRINVETILIEVDRLELTDMFVEDDANIRVAPTSMLGR